MFRKSTWLVLFVVSFIMLQACDSSSEIDIPADVDKEALQGDTDWPEQEQAPDGDKQESENPSEQEQNPDGDSSTENDSATEGDTISDGDQFPDGDGTSEVDKTTDEDQATEQDQNLDGDTIPDGDSPSETDHPSDGDTIAEEDSTSENDLPTDGDQAAESDMPTEQDLPAENDSEPEADNASSWEDVAIESVSSPDEKTVTVVFTRNPGNEASELSRYHISSSSTSLTITQVAYNAGTKTVTLTTSKPKLGVTYTITIQTTPEKASLQADFLAADTYGFWATDFSTEDYADYWLRAYRAGTGQYCVVYVEQGYSIQDIDDIVSQFDSLIYPKMQSAFATPPDFDGNEGRIVFLFLDGDDYYGGYFSPTNQYLNAKTMSWWGRHSNEMEMIHVNVTTYADTFGHVVAHEYQHLLYHDVHGLQYNYWEYHDEGLAECAVGVVFGSNDYALQVYYYDPRNYIRNGLSLTHWNYGLYENYAQAYMFWTYVAGRISGDVSAYSLIFNLGDGNPGEVGEFLQNQLGESFPVIQNEFQIANWLQQESGIYSYNGLASWSSGYNRIVPQGKTSLDLEPYSAAYFKLSANSVDYPNSVGSNIVYVGINGDGVVDKEAPFDITNGVLIVHNANEEYDAWPKEHSGPDVASTGKNKNEQKFPVCEMIRLNTLADPPPVTPDKRELLKKWRNARLKQLGR